MPVALARRAWLGDNRQGGGGDTGGRKGRPYGGVWGFGAWRAEGVPPHIF